MNKAFNPANEAQPHSVEAEQQLLGALLTDNGKLVKVSDILTPDTFYDPVHGEIYRQIKHLVDADKLASPITMNAVMGDHEGLAELGGAAYLVRLAGSAMSGFAVRDYASLVSEMADKRRLLEIIGEAQDLINQGEMSPSDVSAKMEASFASMSAATSRVKPMSMMMAVTNALKDIHAAHKGEERRGVKSGIPAVESFVPVFEAGEMWLLGGRPSMGKTGVALSIATSAARAGHPVVIASLEMRPEALAARAISEATAHNNRAISYTDMKAGKFAPNTMEEIAWAAEDVSKLPITFLPREYQETDLLQVGVKQSLRQMGGDKLPFIVVDYAQLLKSKARSRYEQITDVSLALKGLAMSLGCPVLALSQLSRALESRDDKRPMMSDLRESGQLEQDADGVKRVKPSGSHWSLSEQL